MVSREELPGRLGDVVGGRHVLLGPACAAYERDWTGRFHGRALAVVRPADTAEVSAVLRVCGADGVAVVPRGGGTGLVGAGVPDASGSQVVLSLERLTRLDPVDDAAGQVTVGAGVTLASLQAHAAGAGWAYGVDLAARDSATVGGTVATNAGGVRVVRHGATRAQVLGVEAVLADGGVLSHLGGLVKDNTGYDLAGLLTGSEGTLAVLTALRLRLVPPARRPVTALLGLPDVGTAVRVASALRRGTEGVAALELVTAPVLDMVREVAGLSAPLPQDHPVYLLVETVGEPAERLAEVLATLGVHAAAVAEDTADRARLWAYRERATEALQVLTAGASAPHKLDVTLPADALAAFVEAVPALVAPHRAYLFGHLGDGNVHVNVVGPAPEDDSADRAVLHAVAAAGGSISAEHGIGRAKREHLHLSRSAVEIALMRAVKHAFDPAGTLSPGVLLP